MDRKHKGASIGGGGFWLVVAVLEFLDITIPTGILYLALFFGFGMILYGFSPWISEGITQIRMVRWRWPMYLEKKNVPECVLLKSIISDDQVHPANFHGSVRIQLPDVMLGNNWDFIFEIINGSSWAILLDIGLPLGVIRHNGEMLTHEITFQQKSEDVVHSGGRGFFQIRQKMNFEKEHWISCELDQGTPQYFEFNGLNLFINIIANEPKRVVGRYKLDFGKIQCLSGIVCIPVSPFSMKKEA